MLTYWFTCSSHTRALLNQTSLPTTTVPLEGSFTNRRHKFYYKVRKLLRTTEPKAEKHITILIGPVQTCVPWYVQIVTWKIGQTKWEGIRRSSLAPKHDTELIHESHIGPSTLHISVTISGRFNGCFSQHLNAKWANSWASASGQSPADQSNTVLKFSVSIAHCTSFKIPRVGLPVKSRNSIDRKSVV